MTDDPIETIARLSALLDEARATNKRLNRRCQSAEAGVRENISACRRAGVSLGRMLANAGYISEHERVLTLEGTLRDVLITLGRTACAHVTDDEMRKWKKILIGGDSNP